MTLPKKSIGQQGDEYSLDIEKKHEFEGRDQKLQGRK